MMIKIGDNYLDFNEDIEVEKRIKLFEEIDETLGDFSYAFTIPKTNRNIHILGFPLSDVSNKIIYRNIKAEIIDDSGITIYSGSLRIESINQTEITASFFSGNSNWISLLSGPLSDVDFSDLDTDLTESGISNSWDNEDGIIFPFIDSGGLFSRSNNRMVVEDFTGCIFVKTVFQRIFNKSGIKLKGDLVSDPIFNSSIISRLTLDAESIDNRTSYVQKGGSNQTVSAPLMGGVTTVKISFVNDNVYPFFDGSQNNFYSSSYNADVGMRIDIIANLRYTESEIVPTVNSNYLKFKVYINGVEEYSQDAPVFTGVSFVETTYNVSIKKEFRLEAGDVLELYAEYSRSDNGRAISIHNTSTWKTTPVFLYRTFGNSLVPKWTQAKMVSQYIQLFNCICDFDPVSKILTIDFFDNIKHKTPLDLSNHINVKDTDFSDFVSSFYKKSGLKYGDSDIEELKKYSIREYVGYGSGVISVNNDYIENTGNILESEFKAPASYLNPSFGSSVEKTTFYDMSEEESTDITSVIDSASLAQFNVDDDSFFRIGDLVRITDAMDAYVGDWRIIASGLGFIVCDGLLYQGDSVGKATRIRHEASDDDGVYLLIQTKYREDNVSYFSDLEEYKIGNNLFPNVAYAFFNILSTGNEINDDYKQGLSFGNVSNPLSYQRSLIDTYWNLVSVILNDPVKIKGMLLLPNNIFRKITPLNPIIIKTIESSNLYYLNLITGYKRSSDPAECELIKLS